MQSSRMLLLGDSLSLKWPATCETTRFQLWVILELRAAKCSAIDTFNLPRELPAFTTLPAKQVMQT